MCEKCPTTHQETEHYSEIDGGRRRIIKIGAALGATAATYTLSGASSPVIAAPAHRAVQAWGTTSKDSPIVPVSIKRRAPGPDDVEMDILYAGICHSDIHTARQDWGPTPQPCIPGHEIVGRVTAVGKNVTQFKVGDIGGVGCMVDSCGVCANCKADREQNCLNGATFTYGSEDKETGGYTYGGYSKSIVVKQHFVLQIPKSMDLSRVAPILCAGITTFSPMQHWQLEEKQNVGVIGVGGLGHMAVKLAIAKGAEVTAFTTSPNKVKSIEAMGAKAVVWSQDKPLQHPMGQFDLMIATVPYSFNVAQFMPTMKLDATLVNVGQLGTIDGLSGMMMAFGRQSVAGSLIGGIAETQEVINFCAEHNVLPDVEVIKPSEITRAWERVVDKDIQYRFVIDMQQA